jgi:hypothetical protein
MKHIIYILDSLSPFAIYKKNNDHFQNSKSIKNNFFSKLSKDSIFFYNNYGHGETHSTIYSFLSKKNIYKNNADSFPYAKRNKTDFLNFYNKNKFKKIFFNNTLIGGSSDRYYEEYFPDFLNSFDLKFLRSTLKNSQNDFEKFCKKINIKNILKDNKKILFYIHEMSLHYHKKVFRGGTVESYMEAVKETGLKIKKDLELINYDKKNDTLFFLSDHGMTFRPHDEIFFSKKLTKKKYDQNYYEIFKEKKIKFVFFIKNPKLKNFNVYNFIHAKDIFKIINLFKEVKFINLLKKILKIKNYLLFTSLKSAPGSHHYFHKYIRLFMHHHFIFILDKKKIAYNHAHPHRFVDMNSMDLINEKKIPERIKIILNKYFSYKNYLKKFFFILLEYIIRKLRKHFNNLK